MLHQPRVYTAIRRTTLVLFLAWAFCLPGMAAPNNIPVATNVTATTLGASTLITVSATAPMAFSVSRPDTRTIVVELPGVDTSRLAPTYELSTPLVEAVAIEHSRNPRIRVTLRTAVLDRSQLADNNLVLVLTPKTMPEYAHVVKDSTSSPGQTSNTQQKPTPSPSPAPTPKVVVLQPNQPQSDQGQKYGEPGFIGEPINLNLVNADIRDLLNYITDQYGVNFVIDASVGPVPVTVNVHDVPWNLALESVLKANRLGVEVTGNILRVATSEVLAKESETQKVLNESRLDRSLLVTEFIRLNYARASGTLASASGSTGQFVGGATNSSVTSVGGDQASTGAGGVSGSGEQGLLPIVKRRLSRRGSVEVDGRSNTLIVTDVKENVDTIRQLVTILDQPEPQVEIETRIVIATHNFSRDLGAQLSAGVINLHRGGLGNVSTLPSAGTSSGSGSGGSGSGSGSGGSSSSGPTSGPNPFGVFGGLAGTPVPQNSLAAAAASTVIGLTTGLFGTAQISALITAAESKGQAKTVATPRVTALNNRPAQIESGSQIPVQTTQATAGATTVSTTFVSVPLRLSITPQITDVGTVVLRVTIENNTLNTGIAVGGVPGIDTQRMQSEVLVPDGGTTVMGGVLADVEGDTVNRTPGMASIPVLGNLFKRRLTTRQNSEILFFITPHIYRPDYQGRPTTSAIGTGTRTIQIPQPVPLGNPQTNTPTPTQLQQQQNESPQGPAAPSQNPPSGTTAKPGASNGTRP
jgi:type IV pilus assembly protein PilQ